MGPRDSLGSFAYGHPLLQAVLSDGCDRLEEMLQWAERRAVTNGISMPYLQPGFQSPLRSRSQYLSLYVPSASAGSSGELTFSMASLLQALPSADQPDEPEESEATEA